MFKKMLKNKVILITLVDQALVSGSNFFLSIFILRFFGAEVFGIFSFLWLFILFFNSVQLSLIISPMMSNFSKQDKENKDLFIGSLFSHQIIFCFCFGTLLILSINVIGKTFNYFDISNFKFSILFLFIFTQLQQFFRRLSFLKKNYFKALISDLISYSILFILIIFFEINKSLKLDSLIWILSASYFFGTIIFISNIFKFKINFLNCLNSFFTNWKISKWLFLTSLLQWLSGNLWIINTGIILGPYALGVLRACQTIINITNLAFQSFENFFPTKFSDIYVYKGKKLLNDYFLKFIKKGFKYVLIIIFIIIIFSKKILMLVYGIEISQHSKILIYLSLILPITFVMFPLNYFLRTLDKTKSIFVGYSFSTLFAFLFSNYIISKFDIMGTVLGLFFSSTIILFITFYSYKKI